jgi:hypothetical protein
VVVRAFDAADKPIAFMGDAGRVAISGKILKERPPTSVVAIHYDTINAGIEAVINLNRSGGLRFAY